DRRQILEHAQSDKATISRALAQNRELEDERACVQDSFVKLVREHNSVSLSACPCAVCRPLAPSSLPCSPSFFLLFPLYFSLSVCLSLPHSLSLPLCLSLLHSLSLSLCLSVSPSLSISPSFRLSLSLTHTHTLSHTHTHT